MSNILGIVRIYQVSSSRCNMEHQQYFKYLSIVTVILTAEAAKDIWFPPCQVIVRTRRNTPNSINWCSDVQDAADRKNNESLRDGMNSRNERSANEIQPVDVAKTEVLSEKHVGNVAFLLVPTGKHGDPWSTYIIPPLCFPSKNLDQESKPISELPKTVTMKKGCNCLPSNPEYDNNANPKETRHPGSHIPYLDNLSTKPTSNEYGEVGQGIKQNPNVNKNLPVPVAHCDHENKLNTQKTLPSPYWMYPNPIPILKQQRLSKMNPPIGRYGFRYFNKAYKSGPRRN